MTALQPGAALYRRIDTLHVNVDHDYLSIDPFQDSITAGPKGLARLLGGNTFEDRNTFQDIVCQSIEVISDANAKCDISLFQPPDKCGGVAAALLAIPVCTFRYKQGDDRLRLGMLAQDFARATKTLGAGVAPEKEGSVDYLTMINLMLYQLQRLTVRVAELEAIVLSSSEPRRAEETPPCNNT